ncbi:MAG: hypothetical protein LBL87_07940 [Ruminococcus sp.]|jgi:hypothetical protein|nr:hypothetical protein [Ruminococcus sp.]
MNYKETFLAEDIAKILGNRETAEYLDGVFSVIRSIVGYSTIVCDVLYKEILKENPDKQTVIEVLNESHSKMAELLGDITDAHQLVYKTHITDSAEKVSVNISEIIDETAKKIRKMLEGIVDIEFLTERDIYVAAPKTDVEIILTDMIYRIISYEITPATLRISLERTENGKRAVLSAQGIADGEDRELPSESHNASLMRTNDVARIFARKFCESVNGLILENETDEGMTISLELDTVHAPDCSMCSKVKDRLDIEFVNTRFSPAAVKLAKFSKYRHYKLTDSGNCEN